MIAASHGNVRIARKLIQYGASVKITNKVKQVVQMYLAQKLAPKKDHSYILT